MSINVAEAAAIVAFQRAGGGGGDSDFTTCKVTFTNVVEENAFLIANIPYISHVDDGYLIVVLEHEGNDPITVDAVLYKGVLRLDRYINDAITEVSGNISYDDVAEEYEISGDCSITVNMGD